ncbi:hypothetical protein D5086_022985 [Populus alba]|uniref:Uncharacterized protein n=1 Tax=Populus alba TaxID=43335 RepID=A0ACC4BA39_POPAL
MQAYIGVVQGLRREKVPSIIRCPESCNNDVIPSTSDIRHGTRSCSPGLLVSIRSQILHTVTKELIAATSSISNVGKKGQCLWRPGYITHWTPFLRGPETLTSQLLSDGMVLKDRSGLGNSISARNLSIAESVNKSAEKTVVCLDLRQTCSN